MSIKRLAVIAAVSAFANNSNTSNTTYYNVTGTGGYGSAFGIRRDQQSMRPGTTMHGNVNILLGGAMFSVVIAIVCVVCYCCHRSIKKRTNLYRQRWLENDSNVEIYSVEQCYETSGLFLETSEGLPNSVRIPLTTHGEPPPSYDVVLAMDEIVNRPSPPPRYRTSEINQFKDDGTKYSSNNNGNLCNDDLRFDNLNMCRTDSCFSHEEPVGAAALANQKPMKFVSGNDNFYYSGCPLCGKFQYTSSSIDSELENVINADAENGNEESNCDCPPKDIMTPARKPLNEAADGVTLENNESSTTGRQPLHSNAVQDTLNNNQLLETSDSSSVNHLSNSVCSLARTNLDSINENGIVRLDMSRIIDKTGLPTYEAALKLESSGYV